MRTLWKRSVGAMIAVALIATWVFGAELPPAAEAVVEVTAGNSGGTGVLVRQVGNRYWGRTVAHVVGNHKTISVRVQGQRFPAVVTFRRHVGMDDIAAFTFVCPRKLVVVGIAPKQPAIGERVWSAGYPAFTNRLVIRQGRRVAGHFPTISYQVTSGDSGSPLFSAAGVVGVIPGYLNAWRNGPPTGESYYTPCRLFGRRRGNGNGGGCGPGGCPPDQGTGIVADIDIGTPIDEPTPALLPPVVDEIGRGVRSIDVNVGSIKSVLTEPPAEPEAVNWGLLAGILAAVIAVCGAAGAGISYVVTKD